MARQTRSQRRARRQAQQASAAASGAPPRARRPVADGAQEPHGEPASQPHAHHEPERKGGPINFVRESWAELKKVEWPGQSQLVQGVVVVLLACLIVGAYLFAADQVFKRFVENVLLGQ